MKKKTLALLLLSSLFVLGACSSKTQTTQTTKTKTSKPKEEVTVKLAAAASLQYAFDEKIIPAFEKKYPNVKVEGTYDSSGKLQTQIEQGMDADLFFSAATKQMDALKEEKKIDAKTIVPLLENKLVLIASQKNKDQFKTFEDIKKAKTIAIGDPESVPAGQYAKEVLTSLHLYDTLSDRYSLGTNVTQVLNWVAENSAEVGIVYETDAKTTDTVSIIAPAPKDTLKQPILYPVGILKQTKVNKEAKQFLDFLQTEKIKEVFKGYGFTPQH